MYMKEIERHVTTQKYPIHFFKNGTPQRFYVEIDGKTINIYYENLLTDEITMVIGGKTLMIDTQRITELPDDYIQGRILS